MLQRIFYLLVFSLLLASLPSTAQTIELLTSGTKTSIRGLSVVSDEVIWVSGSGGMVGKSLDGGKTWEWTTVPGFEQREFRDIEAFDANTAVIIAIAEPANILRTTDGGKTWTTVFTDTTKGMFLDAMDFYDNQHGIVIGDPIRDTVFLATTADGGKTWERYKGKPVITQKGEAFFAASGSNILYNKDGSFVAVSGGLVSNLITSKGVKFLPLVQGKETTGANSIARFKNDYFVVGGDFSADSSRVDNCAWFKMEPTDTIPFGYIGSAAPPYGYRSCVAFMGNEHSLISCGPTGVDLSGNRGMDWMQVSQEGFHVCQKAKKGKAIFLAGSKGRIAKIQFPSRKAMPRSN